MKKTAHSQLEALHFDNLAKTAHTSWWGNETPAGHKRQDRRAQIIFSIITPSKKLKVLELGCALGEFTKRLAKNKNLQITAIDISKELLKLTKFKNKPMKNVTFLVADAYQLPFKKNSFDLICGNAILHHLKLDNALKEIKRVGKRNAQIIFFEPNMINPQIFLEKKVRFIGKILQNSPQETAFIRFKLAKKLKKYHFKEISIVPFDFLHPLTPKPCIPVFEKLSKILENTPVIKEISGSLFITAKI